MKYFYLLVVLLFSQFTMGQITKTYITKDGRYSTDPNIATAYILIQKLADTAYLLKEFGMDDTIAMRGTYKDSLLNVKNGKFYYYNKMRSTTHTTYLDTDNYIQRAGYYNNNIPVGTWREYEANGKISKEYSFENGKINGLYKEFYDGYSGKWSEVNVINDQYEGTHKTFTGDSILIEETEYLHNKIISKKLHLFEAAPFDYFQAYLERKLKDYKSELVQPYNLKFIKLTIDKNGHIHNPRLITGFNSKIDSVITQILLNAPPFTPARYDDQLIEETIILPFSLFDEERNKAILESVMKKRQQKSN